MLSTNSQEKTALAAFIFAHPDDESFLSAALIRRLADEQRPPVLLLATKGDAGNKNGDYIGASREELGAVRVEEMKRAANILGIREVEHLGYPDGKLKDVNEDEAVEKAIAFINKHGSSVVVTFPEDGGNHHPDHMAISRIATKAVLSGSCPHVEKLYYIHSPGVKEQGHKPSIIIDTKPYWAMKSAALKAHDSQKLAIARYFGELDQVSEIRRYESFVLAWERGTEWPEKQEQSILDGLQYI